MFGHYYQSLKNLNNNLKWFLYGQLLFGIGHSIYSLLFNLYLIELGHKEGAMGNIASTTSIGMALMALPAALFLERIHVKPLLQFGTGLMCLSYLTQIFVEDLTLLLFCGTAGGMGLALFNISISPFIFRNSSKMNRFILYSINACTVMLAHCLGYFMGGKIPYVLTSFNYSLSQVELYRYSISLGMLTFVGAYFFFSRIQKVPIPPVNRNILDGFKDKDWNIISRLVFPKMSLAFGAGIIIPFMNIYLKTTLKLSTMQLGWVFSTLQIFIFSAIFLSPILSKRISNLKLIIWTCLVSVPFMLMISYQSSLLIVLMSFFIRGMLMNMSGLVTNLFEMEHVKEKDGIFVSSILVMSYHLSWTLSTQLGGYLIENYSFKYSFYVAATFYALAGIFYFIFFSKEEKNQTSLEKESPIKMAA